MKLKTIHFQIVALLLQALFFALPAHAINFFDKDKNIVWQSGLNKYIKLDELDSQKFGLNDHPVNLQEKDISYALQALRVKKDSGFFAKEDNPRVLGVSQIKVLAKYLPIALKTARPDQDIVFVIDKADAKLLGLSELSYTTGRIFFKDGKLNIIIGEFEFFRSKGFENLYDPSGRGNVPYDFNMGSRTRSSKAFDGTPIGITGISNKQLKTLRYDWFLIDVKQASEAFIAKENERNQPGKGAADKQLEIEVAKLAKQRRKMRAEMARMRKEIRNISSAGGASAGSIEERMATLDQLYSKQLITREEYDAKRKEILNDI